MRRRSICVLGLAAATVPAVASASPPKLGAFVPGHSAPIKPGTIPYHADFLAGRPHIGRISAQRLVNGRLAVSVAISYPKLRRHWARLLDDDANYGGLVSLALNDGGRRAWAHETKAVPLGSARQGGRVVQQLVLGTATTRRLLAGGDTLAVRAHVAGRFDQFGDGRPEEHPAANARRTVRVGTARVTAAADEHDWPCKGPADLRPTTTSAPRFVDSHLLWHTENIPIHFQTGPIRFRLCTWSGEPLANFFWWDELNAGDFPGRTTGGAFSNLRVDDGYVTITFTPDRNLGGHDTAQPVFAVEGRGAERSYDYFSIHMYFRPFEMRATGDSITAGWGYLGDGTPPQLNHSDQSFDAIVLKLCSPPDNGPYSNKCSSNSDAGAGYNQTDKRFSADTGLANNVSYAAQFANRHNIHRRSADDQFLTYGNYAVSGARPEHYLEKGALDDPFTQWILQYSPDLTVLTLGANPLLGNFLLDTSTYDYGKKCGGTGDLHYNARYDKAINCMNDALRGEDVYGRLRAVYRRLLDDPYNRIFVAQYPLVFPALKYYAISSGLVNTYDPFILEALTTRLNEEIARAVGDEAALARSQGKGDRLFLYKTARFNFGDEGLKQVLGLGPGPEGMACPDNAALWDVDGPSRQSAATQEKRDPLCRSGQYWLQSLDGGIHLSRDGATEYTNALDHALEQHGVRFP